MNILRSKSKRRSIKKVPLDPSKEMLAGLACVSNIPDMGCEEYTKFAAGSFLFPSNQQSHLVMKIFASIPLSPSVLVPSNRVRNVSSIASSKVLVGVVEAFSLDCRSVHLPVNLDLCQKRSWSSRVSALGKECRLV